MTERPITTRAGVLADALALREQGVELVHAYVAPDVNAAEVSATLRCPVTVMRYEAGSVIVMFEEVKRGS